MKKLLFLALSACALGVVSMSALHEISLKGPAVQCTQNGGTWYPAGSFDPETGAISRTGFCTYPVL